MITKTRPYTPGWASFVYLSRFIKFQGRRSKFAHGRHPLPPYCQLHQMHTWRLLMFSSFAKNNFFSLSQGERSVNHRLVHIMVTKPPTVRQLHHLHPWRWVLELVECNICSDFIVGFYASGLKHNSNSCYSELGSSSTALDAFMKTWQPRNLLWRL